MLGVLDYEALILRDGSMRSPPGTNIRISASDYVSACSVDQRELEIKVSEALAELPWKLDLLLTRRFGLSGNNTPHSVEEAAADLKCSVESFKEDENTALRLLMGYGKKKEPSL